MKYKLTREHYTLNPNELSLTQRNLVILHKIFQAITNNVPLDVMNDYLTSRLSIETLNNPLKILELLESRKADWRQRLQVLEFLDSNLETNKNLASLFETDNALSLIIGWTAQLLDERSNLIKSAAELFPSILSTILRNIETPNVIFSKEQKLLDSIFESFFVLLRSKRAKILTDIAHQAIIATVDILGTVAADLDPEAHHRILDLLSRHTKLTIEKHEKVRAECMFYALYLIYGIERDPNDVTPLLSPRRQLSIENADNNLHIFSDNNDDQKQLCNTKSSSPRDLNSNDDTKPLIRWKLANKAQREFLFEDKIFLNVFQQMLSNGIDDKSKEVRDTTMKALTKIEQTYEKIFNNQFDRSMIQKYLKWKKFNAPKKDTSTASSQLSLREKQKLMRQQWRQNKENFKVVVTNICENEEDEKNKEYMMMIPSQMTKLPFDDDDDDNTNKNTKNNNLHKHIEGVTNMNNSCNNNNNEAIQTKIMNKNENNNNHDNRNEDTNNITNGICNNINHNQEKDCNATIFQNGNVDNRYCGEKILNERKIVAGNDVR